MLFSLFSGPVPIDTLQDATGKTVWRTMSVLPQPISPTVSSIWCGNGNPIASVGMAGRPVRCYVTVVDQFDNPAGNVTDMVRFSFSRLRLLILLFY